MKGGGGTNLFERRWPEITGDGGEIHGRGGGKKVKRRDQGTKKAGRRKKGRTGERVQEVK